MTKITYNGTTYRLQSSGRYYQSDNNCAHCGKEFKANRHRKTACCSRTCANRRRAWME